MHRSGRLPVVRLGSGGSTDAARLKSWVRPGSRSCRPRPHPTRDRRGRWEVSTSYPSPTWLRRLGGAAEPRRRDVLIFPVAVILGMTRSAHSEALTRDLPAELVPQGIRVVGPVRGVRKQSAPRIGATRRARVQASRSRSRARVVLALYLSGSASACMAEPAVEGHLDGLACGLDGLDQDVIDGSPRGCG